MTVRRIWTESDEGDGAILRGRDMPPKVDGRHRWVAVAQYVLSDTQASAAAKGGAVVRLDHENRVGVYVGCFDCEAIYQDAAGRSCPAGDEWQRGGKG